MDIGLILVIAMFLSLILCLMSGFPVAFVLAGVGLIFGGVGVAMGAIDFRLVNLLPQRIYDNIILNELLFAIPLFIAMGVILEKSGIAEDLLGSMGRLLRRVKGGLAISVTLVGALLAASTGIVGATVVTMGLLSLPSMMRQGYQPAFATGSIAAAGTLGQIIPPSIVLILLTEVLSNSWSLAQQEMGIFSPTPITTGELFAAALVPGMLLVGLYLLYQLIVARFVPRAAPAPDTTDEALDVWGLFKALLPPLTLILAVLGSILMGVATPTKAAAVGTVGAMVLAGFKKAPASKIGFWVFLGAMITLFALSKFVDLRSGQNAIATMIGYGLSGLAFISLLFGIIQLYRTSLMANAMAETVRVSTMIYAILIGAALFSLVFRGLGGDDAVEELLLSMGGGFWGALLFVMILMFILGFFLDFIEITFVVVPVVAPVLLAMDGSLGPLWLGIMIAMNLQTSFLTPPFGFALFYLRGVMDKGIPTRALYRGAIPFVLIQLFTLLLLTLFPEIVIWLPEQLRP